MIMVHFSLIWIHFFSANANLKPWTNHHAFFLFVADFIFKFDGFGAQNCGYMTRQEFAKQCKFLSWAIEKNIMRSIQFDSKKCSRNCERKFEAGVSTNTIHSAIWAFFRREGCSLICPPPLLCLQCFYFLSNYRVSTYSMLCLDMLSTSQKFMFGKNERNLLIDSWLVEEISICSNHTEHNKWIVFMEFSARHPPIWTSQNLAIMVLYNKLIYWW